MMVRLNNNILFFSLSPVLQSWSDGNPIAAGSASLWVIARYTFVHWAALAKKGFRGLHVDICSSNQMVTWRNMALEFTKLLYKIVLMYYLDLCEVISSFSHGICYFDYFLVSTKFWSLWRLKTNTSKPGTIFHTKWTNPLRCTSIHKCLFMNYTRVICVKCFCVWIRVSRVCCENMSGLRPYLKTEAQVMQLFTQSIDIHTLHLAMPEVVGWSFANRF